MTGAGRVGPVPGACRPESGVAAGVVDAGTATGAARRPCLAPGGPRTARPAPVPARR